MARAHGRGKKAPRENQAGLAAYAIGTVCDAPLSELAALVKATREAPLAGPALLRPNASGGWAGDRSHDELMKEGARFEDVAFSKTFAACLDLEQYRVWSA